MPTRTTSSPAITNIRSASPGSITPDPVYDPKLGNSPTLGPKTNAGSVAPLRPGGVRATAKASLAS